MNTIPETKPEWKLDPSTKGHCVQCHALSGLDHAGICWTCDQGWAVYPEHPTMIRQLGKFEGSCRYVPYFWEAFLNGMADRDDGRILGFDITPEDKAIFPELARRRTVKLVEDSQGFVHEV